MIERKLLKDRQTYKIQKGDRFFAGRLWIRKLWKHDGGYSAFVFIGKDCLGRVYLNELGILFNLKTISTYNKTHCKENTIRKHFRKAIVDYFETFEITHPKPQITTKPLVQGFTESYFKTLRSQVIGLSIGGN